MDQPRNRPRSPLRRRLAALAIASATLALAAARTTAAPASAAATRSKPAAGSERRLILFYTAEVHGTVEPCGCTSDPLGDISRLATVVANARRTHAGVGLVDAGSLSYPEGSISPRERASADMRADFLGAEIQKLGLLGAALGETDGSGGASHIHPMRLASNITGAPAVVQPATVRKVGDINVGVLGVVDPAIAGSIGAQATDMFEAARRDVGLLRQRGAEVVVVLAPVDKNQARKLARESGADVVVIGKRVGKGMSRLEHVGRAFLVAPQDELQRVGRLEIVLRRPAAATVRGGAALELQDAGGTEANRLRRDEIDHALDRLRADLAQWTLPAGAGAGRTDGVDAAFVASKRREQADLQAERARLDAPWTPPATGDYVVNQLVPLGRSLPRDPAVAAAMKKLDQAIAAVNLRQASPPPAPEPDRAYYVGTDKCVGCHPSAVAFWKHTVHARAWKTLVDGGKQSDYKCIGCHTTGFGQIGGSSLGFTKNLESVQCETCHGPGSAHVAQEENGGNSDAPLVKRDAPETVCLGCHTEQHSDTFQYEAYLRDIVGPGHGPKRREQLGAGATGHQLRSAALAKAKLADAARVKKM